FSRDWSSDVCSSDLIFKGGSGIKYAQIYQDEKGFIELRIVPDETYKDLNGENLLYELKKRVGEETPTKLVILSSIDKAKNGKFRSEERRVGKEGRGR